MTINAMEDPVVVVTPAITKDALAEADATKVEANGEALNAKSKATVARGKATAAKSKATVGHQTHPNGHTHKSHAHTTPTHTSGGGCCHDHSCMCAKITTRILKDFIPLLSEERTAELQGWTANDETWSCVPNHDAPAFAVAETAYSFKHDKVANELPTVNTFMKVLNGLSHHVKALPSRFFSQLSYSTDLAQHDIDDIDDITTRIVIPTHRFGAWIGIVIEPHAARAIIFDPCKTLSEHDFEEIKGRLSVFNVKEHIVIIPNHPINMRYSVIAVCSGVEVLARAGWAPVATRVLGKLVEMIERGGDFDAILSGLTEEMMHANDDESAEQKLAAKMDLLAVDHASNRVAEQLADRIVWALATGEPNAPKWTCGCDEKAKEVASADSRVGKLDHLD